MCTNSDNIKYQILVHIVMKLNNDKSVNERQYNKTKDDKNGGILTQVMNETFLKVKFEKMG